MNTTTNTRGVSEAMVTHQAAAEALDSLDDYARMGTGVDAHGPRGLLERYIAQQAALSPEPAAQEEAVADECPHEWVDYVQAEYKPRHRVFEPGESNIERYVRIGLMCTTCGKEKPAPATPPAPPAERYRDAYEGAREDLLDWKRRAQRAEDTLRSLGYRGIDASEPPAQPVWRAVGEGRVMVTRASLEVAQGDLHRLKKAIEARVPVPALLFRVTEIKRDLCAMLAASPAPSDGGKGVDDDPPTCPICDQMKLSARCSACGYEDDPSTGAAR